MIVTTEVTLSRAEMERRIQRRNTKSDLSYTLSRLWDLVHDMEDGEVKKRLIDELMQVVY